VGDCRIGLSTGIVRIDIATTSGTADLIKFFAAVLRKSWKSRPGQPASLHAVAQDFRISAMGLGLPSSLRRKNTRLVMAFAWRPARDQIG
jgi:hypothetical protein